MGHTYTRLRTHIILRTRERIAYLLSDRRQDVFAYIGGIVREIGGVAMNINGFADHVHLLIRIPASMAVAEAVNLVKTNSSRWVHARRVLHRTFGWQTGYA